MDSEIVLVKRHLIVGGRVHLAAQAFDTRTGRWGPTLTSEGCNLDDTVRESRGTPSDGSPCERCNNWGMT